MFNDDDSSVENGEKDDPIVVEATINNDNVKQEFIDQESSTNILFYVGFKGIAFTRKESYIPYNNDLFGFTRDDITTLNYIDS